MLVINEKDLQDLKTELKAELIKEMRTEEIPSAQYPLIKAKAKWFYGEGGCDKYDHSTMDQEFERHVTFKVWEHIMRLTTLILGRRYMAQLASLDPEVCNMVCDRICNTVLELRKSDAVQEQIKNKS